MNIKSHFQKGATLIIVLFILLLITIVGVIGIRIAMTSLNIATNSQAGQLLVQNSDTPNNYFLNLSKYNDLTKLTTAVGQAVELNKTIPGREIVFCYRPTSAQLVDSSLDTTVLVPPAKEDASDSKATIDSTLTSRAGFCDLSKDFGSSRQAVVTQVAVKIITEGGGVGDGLERGTNQSEGSTEGKGKVEARVRVTSTAILPNFSKVNLQDVQNDCIGSGSTVGYINDNLGDLVGKKTVADCLSSYGVPVNVQIQEFQLRQRNIQIEAP
ncbi:hypothetical protein [Acinetobacter ursingii]|uniref:hypothetical protein n=1 Tax=Acinetobacter ursingii TaxID=108980 RepID=UPI00300BE61B